MKSSIKSFRDLHVWQRASELATLIYKETARYPAPEVYGLTSQMRRAAISISSNIAEGFKRNSNKEKVQFYSIANGSLAELESQLEISKNLGYLGEDMYEKILNSINEESRMLNSLISSTHRNFPPTASLCILGSVFLYFLFFILYSPAAADAAEIGLGVTKNTFDLAILKGDSYEGNLGVFNKSKGLSLPVHIELSMWDLKEDEDDIEFVLAEPALNATKWFTIEEERDFILGPDRSKQIHFTIEPPSDAVPGSYFVMMRFRAVPPKHYFAESGPRLIPEIGVLFFIRLASLSLEGGQDLYGAEILAFEKKGAKPIPVISSITPVAQASVIENFVQTFAVQVRNTGFYHFKTNGSIEVLDLFGNTVAKADMPEKYLLPNRNRSFDIDIIQGEQSFWRRNSYFGPYTAQLVLYIPGRDAPLIMKEQFWVFPWKTILVLLVVAVAFLLTRRRIRMAGKALLSR